MVACSSDNEQVRSEIITWMVDEELVEKLIDLLNNDENIHSDVHTLVNYSLPKIVLHNGFSYAATALCELITILRQENSEAARCPLLNRLTQTSTIEKGYFRFSGLIHAKLHLTLNSIKNLLN